CCQPKYEGALIHIVLRRNILLTRKLKPGDSGARQNERHHPAMPRRPSQQPVRTNPAKVNPAKTNPAKTNPANAKSTKAQSMKARPVKPRPAKQATTTPGRKNMKAAERERVILDTAIRFFAEQGFEGQTRELAKRIGITHSAIYRHFPSK